MNRCSAFLSAFRSGSGGRTPRCLQAFSRRGRFCIAASVALLIWSCAADRDLDTLFVPQDEGVVVVDAMLVVGQRLPFIRLARTGDLEEPFDLSAVLGSEDVAVVQIRQDGEVLSRYSFDPESGFWTPDAVQTVQPNTRYDLVVNTAAAEAVRASTLTPPALEIEEWIILDPSGNDVLRELAIYDGSRTRDQVFAENQVVYSTGLLEARFARPAVPAFQVGINSLDLGSDYVIDPDFFDEEDFEDLERIGSSPPLEAEDGTLRLPWFAIFFEGRYTIRIFAMDQNWYDLARSAPGFVDGGPGFGGQAGDNFERPIFRVEGGIGLFGSASVDSLGLYVNPRP